MITYTPAEINVACFFREVLQSKSIAKIHQFFRQGKFRQLAKGTYKVCYFSPEYPTLVFKVYKTKSGYLDDSRSRFLDKVKRKYFLTPAVHTKKFIIQRRFNRKGGTARQAASILRDRLDDAIPKDIDTHNCAFHDGKPYFFDFVT